MQKSTWRLLFKQFSSPIVLILLLATTVSMVAGDLIDGVMILAVIIPTGLLGFFQERRAGKVMETLLKRVQLKSEVMRDGVEVSLPADELVLGDVVVLNAGDLVPGDLQLIESNALQVDESALTGESFAREKSLEADSELWFGSHVVSGSAKAKLVALGYNTKFGALEKSLAGKDVVTAFERGTNRFGYMLVRAMLLLVTLVFAGNLLLHRPLVDSLLFAAALAVGLTPQLLPVIMQVSLSAGARRMADKQVLVKRLDAIEDFGSITVLCSDKTGTLTKGVVKLSHAFDMVGAESTRVRRLAYLNAVAQTGFNNPMDQAIIEALKLEFVDSTHETLAELPYDFERRRLSVLVRAGDLGEKPVLITKGAVPEVLQVCQLTRLQREKIDTQMADLSAQGFRVIAVATKTMDAASRLDPKAESELSFEGLLVLSDEVKPDAAAAIAELLDLGIKFYLLTGDNKLVANQIAKQVGLPLDRVFAELDPLQKEQIVLKLRSQGETVGVLGDGINDSAAIKAADVGIAVDSGVDVAKQAAAIVLMNQDLSVVAEGVRLGRRTFANTIKYIRVTISANFGNMVSMSIISLFLPFLPLLPLQILLLNLISDIPALMISGDSVDPEDMKSPQAWKVKDITRFMVRFGLVSSIFDLLTFALLLFALHANEAQFQSGWFVESTLTELAAMLVLRTTRRFYRSRPSRGLLISSIAVAALVIALPFSFLAPQLKLVALAPLTVVALLGLTAIYIAANELLKRPWRRWIPSSKGASPSA